MKVIKYACIIMRLSKAQQKYLEGVMNAGTTVFFDRYDLSVQNHIRKADVIITSYPVDKDILYENTNLSWIHYNMAGLEKYLDGKLLRNGVIITGASGRSTPSLSEHVFFFMLQDSFCVKKLLEDNRLHNWNMDTRLWRPLYGKTITILGMGNIGNSVAQKAATFGMTVLGFSRRKREVEYPYKRLYYGILGLKEAVSVSDYIITTMSLTNETYHLINKDIFSCMKRDAFIINISRGKIINEADLIVALKDHKIRGAGLDVFENEPLSKSSQLWDMDNVLITPHQSPILDDRMERTIDIIQKNILAYQQEDTMINSFSVQDVFEQN